MNLSLTRFFQNLLIALIIIIAFYFTVLGSFHGYETHNGWMIDDWLINYQGGFVRRGLLGEFIYNISIYLKSNPGLIVFYFQVIFYFLFFIFTYFSILWQKNLNSYMLMIVSPFIFYFQVFDIQGGYRKEIIFFAILAFIVWSANKFRDQKLEIIFIITLLFYPLLILTHEMLAIFLPYILIVYTLKIPINKRRLLYLVPLLSLSIFALLASILNHGDSSTVSSIINSLEVVDYKPKEGAINALSWSLERGFTGVVNRIENSSYIKILTFNIFLSLLALIPLFPKYKQLFRNKIIIFLLLIIAIGTIILYLTALDWGRFLYINLVSLFLISLVIDKNINEPKNSFSPIFLLIFGVIYFSTWHIHHTGSNPIMPNINSTNIDTLINRVSINN